MIALPQTTLWLRGTPATLQTDGTLGNDATEQLMRGMSQPREGAAAPPGR